MKLQVVPARQGVVWVRRAFTLYAKRPVAFAALFGACLFFVLLLQLLPFVGPVLLLALLPLGSLAFMIAARTAIEGRAPTPSVLFDTLRGERSRRIALLQLGALYAVATVAIMLFADVIDGGGLEALLQSVAEGKATAESAAAAMSEPSLQFGMLLRFGLAGLLSVPFWFAPALVYWDKQSAIKSLFFSSVACWRNKGAFTAYSLAWVAVILLFGVILNLVLALLGQVQLVAWLTLPATLAFTTVFYVSLYFTFTDCFVEAPQPVDAATSP